MVMLFISCDAQVDTVDAYIGSYVISESDPIDYGNGLEQYYLREGDNMVISRFRKDTVVLECQNGVGYVTGMEIYTGWGHNMGVVTNEGLLLDSTYFEATGKHDGKDCCIITRYKFLPAKLNKKTLTIPYTALKFIRYTNTDYEKLVETYKGKEIVATKL